MSGLLNEMLDWNADLDEITSQHGVCISRRRGSTGGLDGSSGALDWNMDLDDLIDNKDTKEFRRHSAPTSLPSRRKANAVRFGKVQIRDCERVMGDNPGCEKGPSLSIGWKYNTRQPINLDKWEAVRTNKRRNKKELCIPRDKRVMILVEAGFARKDIERNMELISYFREERNETLMQLHMEKAAKSIADKLRRGSYPANNTVYC